MSRTLRAVPFHNTVKHTINRYKDYSWANNLKLLDNPPPRVDTSYVYEAVTESEVKHWYKVVPKGTPLAHEAREWSFWRATQRTPDGKIIPIPREGEWYITISYTVEKTWKRRLWSPTMYPVNTTHEWDEDAIDLWREYQTLHRLRYRNGTSRRQRINGIRMDKKSASRRHRRTQDAMAIRDGMNSLGDEMMPSHGSRQKYRKW